LSSHARPQPSTAWSRGHDGSGRGRRPSRAGLASVLLIAIIATATREELRRS
jgi:hypothetical protein